MTHHIGYRIEKDSMGEIEIPEHCLYGASTQRAFENFPVSGIRFSRDFIKSLAIIKATCAEVNAVLGKLDDMRSQAIIRAAKDIASGEYDEHFVLDIFQTGSGTSTNMNFNEVAANLANQSLGARLGSEKPIHPNDHVNMGQSSNDIIPTTMHVTAALAVTENLLPALKELQISLGDKAKAFMKFCKTGRTHLQDATPILLGQEFSGYEYQVKKSVERVERALPSIYELAIGGTAVGTGLNTDANFGHMVAERLAKTNGLPFRETENHFEAQASKDACVDLSGALKTTATALTKIANDVRWLSSGPRCGFEEITLPAVQPGSSIMPGKINPVMAESLLQVCAHIMGNDLAVSIGGANGNFELNVMMPLIAHNLLQSIQILANAVRNFTTKCVQGIRANEDHLRDSVERSLMLVTPLTTLIGYDRAAQISETALKEGKSISDIALATLDLSKDELSKVLDPFTMVTPSGRKLS